jgi:CspA family cold shock protein
MSTGTVKWFNPTKGYGFIQPQGGGQDVFVHISAVEKAGLSRLNEGQKVEFEIVSNRGKSSAENLKVKWSDGEAPSDRHAPTTIFVQRRDGTHRSVHQPHLRAAYRVSKIRLSGWPSEPPDFDHWQAFRRLSALQGRNSLPAWPDRATSGGADALSDHPF